MSIYTTPYALIYTTKHTTHTGQLIIIHCILYIGLGQDYNTAIYKRLGYLSLDSNERSNYQARELKTVFVDQRANYIKFRIQKNYINDENSFNQVSIMAVTFSGDDSADSLAVSLPSTSTTSHTQQLQQQHASNRIPNNHQSNPLQSNPLGIEIQLDMNTLTRLRLLSEAKKRAVEREDYSMAKAIKTIEIEFKDIAITLSQIDSNKRNAVVNEEYDLAAELKEKGDELRQIMSEKVSG